MLFRLSAQPAGSLGHGSRGFRRRAAFLLLLSLLIVAGVHAAEGDEGTVDRSASYFHFALGHLYHQFAQQFADQEHYVDRAVQEYTAALKSDPKSVVIRTEMIKLFAGARRLPKAEALAEEMFTEDPDNVELRRLLGSIYSTYAKKPRQGVDRAFLQKAIGQFERVVDLEPDKADNHMELGRLYQVAGKPSVAEKSLRRALELDPGHSGAEVTLAYLLLETGNFREGINVLEGVVEGGTSDRRHLDSLASAYEQTGRFREAAAALQKLVGQGGNSLQIRQRLADSLMRSRQFGRALEHFRELAESDPRNPIYFLRISEIERQRNDFPKAWEAWERASRLDRESVDVQLHAIALFISEDKTEQAVEETEKLLVSTRKAEYTPNEKERRAMLLGQLGTLQREINRPEAAVATFEKIAKLAPEARPRVLFQIVETWRSARDFARAEREARKAVEIFSEDTQLTQMLASVLADRSKTKDAIKVIQKSIKNGQPDIDALLTMARIYERGRQFDKAADQVDQASELAKSEQARVAILFAYGSLYERSKQYEKAESKLRDLIAIDPDNAAALNYLGYMFADLSVHLDEAHDLIQKALDLDPNNGAYLDSLGWVYYRQNKFDLAAKYLERSLKQYEDDPVVHSHLGDVYFSQGRVADAKQHWSRGLEEWSRSAPADRDSAEIESLRRKLTDLELSMAESPPGTKKKGSIQR